MLKMSSEGQSQRHLYVDGDLKITTLNFCHSIALKLPKWCHVLVAHAQIFDR